MKKARTVKNLVIRVIEKSGNKGNDSLVSVFAMPIFGMLRTMFMPFLSVEYNSEEKNEE